MFFQPVGDNAFYNELLYIKVCIYDLAISICGIEISYYKRSLQQPDMNNDI